MAAEEPARSDPFDDVLMIEEDGFRRGLSEGEATGRRLGHTEGQLLGAQRGYVIGQEIGFYEGVCIALRTGAAAGGGPPSRQERLLAAVDRLSGLLDAFALGNEDKERDMAAELQRIRAKFMVCKSLARLDLRSDAREATGWGF